MQKANYNRGELVPRVMKTMIGDIFTTNCLEGAGAKGVEFKGTEDLVVGAELSPNAQGYLSLTGDKSIVFQVVKVYTMPDGQAAVKVMRIK